MQNDEHQSLTVADMLECYGSLGALTLEVDAIESFYEKLGR